jgi:antitoxin YefM
VIISLDDFTVFKEIASLPRMPKNARRLIESVAEVEKGGHKERAFAT